MWSKAESAVSMPRYSTPRSASSGVSSVRSRFNVNGGSKANQCFRFRSSESRARADTTPSVLIGGIAKTVRNSRTLLTLERPLNWSGYREGSGRLRA